MEKKKALLDVVAKLKESHRQATDILAEISNGLMNIDGSESVTTTAEMFERYQAVLAEAKIYAMQGRMIFADPKEEN